MGTQIEMRVRHQGEERLLRLGYTEGKWYAALLKPGKRDYLTDECPAPSPPGTQLPAMKLQDFDLRIERPPGNVESLEVGRLRLSRRVVIEDGWVQVPLGGIMAEYGDLDDAPRGKQSLAEIKATSKGRTPHAGKDSGRETDR
jgi:hypothetical protein